MIATPELPRNTIPATKTIKTPVLQEKVRKETDAFLRDLAFVLKMTAKVKQDMVTGK